MRHFLTLAGTMAAIALGLLLTLPALAVDSGGPVDPADYADDVGVARQLIDAGDFAGAVRLLKPVIGNGGNTDANVLNLMGYALRKSGDTPHALGFYLKALAVNPRHRGANEYLGELYVETGEIGKAEERLAVLAEVCGVTCEEYLDLAEALGR